mmetsp:Transcript_39376/g.83252  ORF Transcript_39376/g.83252 Transcript_39376/m.83252 type:complete len:103 (+) Transcript_39376:2-310(+)
MAMCWMQDEVCLDKCADGKVQECLQSDLQKADCAANSTHNMDCAFRCADGSDANTTTTMMDMSAHNTTATTTATTTTAAGSSGATGLGSAAVLAAMAGLRWW